MQNHEGHAFYVQYKGHIGDQIKALLAAITKPFGYELKQTLSSSKIKIIAFQIIFRQLNNLPTL